MLKSFVDDYALYLEKRINNMDMAPSKREEMLEHIDKIVEAAKDSRIGIDDAMKALAKVL